MTPHFRVTLMRSAIGLPRKYAGVLRALGLRKRLRTVYHPVTPDVAGQIFAVKELVDVQEVDRKLEKSEMAELRKPEPGFWVENRVTGAGGLGAGLRGAREENRRVKEMPSPKS